MAARNEQTLTLYELNRLVAEVISIEMPEQYWVEAEISELREVRGHCYLELVQKSDLSATPVARASAKCWKNTWIKIYPKFVRITGQSLHVGMKVMLRVYPNFHEAFGFSWIVTDINPEFSLGDIARRRKEIIQKLHEEGIFDLQKSLMLSMFAQRIAIISSAGAAGYDDFCNQLENNQYGFSFSPTLFSATMQGENVEESVVQALNLINDSEGGFDAVVIIRGGGATSDLSGFDTLRLAENVANFPIPIVTGIGHNRDESIIDMVAFASVKTPTAAAAFLIDNLAQTWERLDKAANAIHVNANRKMEYEKLRLNKASTSLQSEVSIALMRQRTWIESIQKELSHKAEALVAEKKHQTERLATMLSILAPQTITNHRHRLNLLEKRAEALNPTLLLRRGYSITLKDGKAIKDASTLKKGDKVETKVANGSFKSTVE